ncbi:LysM peptidoglycan-binding domain-containing protein [Gallaecimonas sp. GXIMD4217]|uniref:LysM peptidoglycan-binding domain-containing protein n=1 Tax=Gallaecimonas sp. GXIMD4217 TaxID=3131927 RepID=UPI00311B1D41
MKKTTLGLLLPLLLAGCQLTSNETESNEPLQVVAAAQPDQPEVLPDEPASSEVDVLTEEKPATPQDAENVWLRIRDQFTLEYDADQKRIAVQKAWFEKHPKYIERVSQRAEPFLHLIVCKLEEAGLPLELALLPIVESAFDPFAYSHGRASGMWQFISGTGKRFGMPQDWWYDGRRDVLASTEGAIAYLQYLNKMFDGDWLHALAAYNSGEGRVMRAIKYNKKKGKDTSFWSLKLPKETRAYVPRLLALVELLKDDSRLALWTPVANSPRLAAVEVKQQLDLSVAAELAGLELKKLHALNPGFNRWATSPDRSHRLLLPVDKAEAFETKLAALPKEKRLRWARHQVKSGDSLIKIAKRYDTQVAVLRQANNINGNLIRVGQQLMVPLSSQALEGGLPGMARANRRQPIKHRVVAGDTLWDIARKYKVSVKQLTKWNRLSGKPLQLNQKLVVWLDGDSAKGITRNVNYKVRKGDSLSRIASKFNVKVADLVKWNQLDTGSYLQPGQVLKLLVDVTKG